MFSGDGDAEMLGRGAGGSELEAGIDNVFAGLRGAGASSSMVEGYERYMGGKNYVDGELVTEDPEGAVDNAFQSFVLDQEMVAGGALSSYPRVNFTLVARRCWDVRNVGVVGLARPQCAKIFRCRFLERSLRCFQIPPEISCDRTLVEEARDGLHVKAMYTWLIEGGKLMPVLTTDAIGNFVMGERSGREWKTSFSMLMASGRVLSCADYQCFQSRDAHAANRLTTTLRC